MRTRARPEQPHDEKTQAREREEKSRVRVPKIQYRFIRQLEQEGVAGQERVGALAMADKIKRYPLEDRHVMGSWERFTKRAIEEFKANKGDPAERDRTHAAYAVVFSALREGPPAQSIGELKQRIEGFSAQHPPTGRATEGGDGRAPAPRQRSFAEVAREEPHPAVERQAETALASLRGLSPALRASIEASARELILEGHHTQASARAALPDSVRELQEDRGERNTVHTLTLALIAKAPEHRALLRELADLPREQARAIEIEGRARLERYPPLETGLADVRRDAVEAAVKSAVDPTAHARREALVLAHAREELEDVADPKRLQWQSVGQELARDLA
ncbi:MAG: hypothetical protein IT383_01170 [Deltaproteobacteria bacterium]|nr:hypothetical protein [Deltaproteobacteria bacterium]